MTKASLIAAAPLTLALVACGEPMDGSDTADLGSDVTEAQTGPTDAPAYEPGEDGPLQADVQPEVEPAPAEDSSAEGTLETDGSSM